MIITLEYKDKFPISYQMDPNIDSLYNIDKVVYLRHKYRGKEESIYLGYTRSPFEACEIIKFTNPYIENRDNVQFKVEYDKDDPQRGFEKLVERKAKG